MDEHTKLSGTVQDRAARDMVVLLELWKEKKRKQRIYRYSLLGAMLLCIAALFGVGYYYLDQKIPSDIHLKAGVEQILDLQVPMTAQVVAVSEQGSGVKGTGVAGDKVLTLNLGDMVRIVPGNADSYLMNVRLFGWIPFKQVDIRVIEEQELIPMGIPVGIYMETEGLLVLEVGSFIDHSGKECSPAEDILKAGDYVLALNGEAVEDKDLFMEAIETCGGREVELLVKRGEEQFEVCLTPKQNQNGEYKLGIWIRDNAQGVGTMTFLDADGKFGALGHGINDVDTSALMQMKDGTLYRTEIVEIRKGEEGAPGEMTGMIIYSSEYILGDIDCNSEIGIFGTCERNALELAAQEPLPIGLKQEIQKGEAQILCTVDEEPEYFTVEITGIRLNSSNVNRGIELKVTDPELIERTGGIVQGMSGSPIIQDGKLVGAVTHVFVNDPTRGYGIFIENMLAETEKIK